MDVDLFQEATPPDAAKTIMVTADPVRTKPTAVNGNNEPPVRMESAESALADVDNGC
jgi:hypothetical protein